MKKNFGFDVELNKLKVFARSLWMGFGHGEGELEIRSQGRFKKSRFTQETEAIGQQAPRNGEHRPKLRFTHRVSSAGCTGSTDSTPQFFSSGKENSPQGKYSFEAALPGLSFEGEITRHEFTKGIQQTHKVLQEILKAAGFDEDSKL